MQNYILILPLMICLACNDIDLVVVDYYPNGEKKTTCRYLDFTDSLYVELSHYDSLGQLYYKGEFYNNKKINHQSWFNTSSGKLLHHRELDSLGEKILSFESYYENGNLMERDFMSQGLKRYEYYDSTENLMLGFYHEFSDFLSDYIINNDFPDTLKVGEPTVFDLEFPKFIAVENCIEITVTNGEIKQLAPFRYELTCKLKGNGYANLLFDDGVTGKKLINTFEYLVKE